MKVNIDGHQVDADKVDNFFNGDDGSRVTDEQWDISRDRASNPSIDLAALGFAYLGDRIPDGDEFGEVDG